MKRYAPKIWCPELAVVPGSPQHPCISFHWFVGRTCLSKANEGSKSPGMLTERTCKRIEALVGHLWAICCGLFAWKSIEIISLKVTENDLDQFWSNRILFFKEWTKTKKSMISGFLDPSEPLFMDSTTPNYCKTYKNLWELFWNIFVLRIWGSRNLAMSHEP